MSDDERESGILAILYNSERRISNYDSNNSIKKVIFTEPKLNFPHEQV